MNKAKEDKDKAETESRTIKSAFEDSVKKLPIQSSVIATPIPSTAPAPAVNPEVLAKIRKPPSPSPTVPQNAAATPPIENVTSTSPKVAQFLVTQSTENSDDQDVPNKISVVVQTNVSFPSLR
jgi:hypothetical protein